MGLISVVVPCFNERQAIRDFHAEISEVASRMSPEAFEFVFVDDGSTDGTLDEMKRLRTDDPRVRYVSFSRNFGKEAAIFAGLRYAKGDLVAVMDADMQDPPSLLPEMYRAVTTEGFDCAAARRVTRTGEGRIRSWSARVFYRLFNRISDTGLVDGARDFRLMTRQVVDAVLALSEVNRFSKGIFSWVGFRTKWLEYDNIERSAGSSKWPFGRLLRYSVEGIVDFSTAPLSIASTLGLVFCAVSFLWVAIIFFRTTIYGDPVPGWPSLASIVLFANGVQLFTIGILGQYIARTYLETKNRPLYVVRESDE